jgi:uncharacterized protein
MIDLQCPKCHAAMRSIERNGIVIDRCSECGGIFLDRGELERLIRAESAYEEHRPVASRGFRDDDNDNDDDRHHGRPPKKRRRNFLEDLLDFG